MLREIMLLCLCYGLLDRTSAEESTAGSFPSVYEHCGNLQVQEHIQLRMIAGTWYVIEILQHKTDVKLYRGDTIDMESCPHVYMEFDGLATELKMFWYEEAVDVEYTFKIYDRMASPGYWVSAGAQNVSLKENGKYNQFAGSVHVRKAVSDHLVLTFCSPNSELYSVILAREKWLHINDLRSITNQMNRLKLPITQTKRACRNSSSTIQSAFWLMAAFGLGHFLINRFKQLV
ncbi:uncharacterized protein LOC126842840 [Adelges cooleyi]|uniref:uncharacterized protein LOC126842840 n=1 Tax=Adelges cooleyi TaxID=133065 RepID=UPI00218078BC|nr:uncharacterized protein LOC126842840 [Adelges cooleyi]